MSFAGLALAGGVLKAGSQFTAGQEERNIAESEANRLDQQANLTKISAKFSAEAKRKAMKRLMSSQIAGAAGAGVSVGTGSSLNLLLETAQDAELEIGIDNFNATNEQIAARNQAESLRKQGRGIERSSRIQAASTLIVAGTTFATKKGAFNSKQTIGSKNQTVGGGAGAQAGIPKAGR